MLEHARLRATLPALDIERAKAFYRDTLGLAIVLKTPDGVVFELPADAGHPRVGWADTATFLVFPTPNPNRGGHTQLGFLVDDIEAIVAELKGRGVVFEEYDNPAFRTTDGIAAIARGNGRGAWFKDTEGNLIGLVQLNY